METEIVNRFATILVSVDGREEITDTARGAGVYRRVINNVRKIKENGYDGEIIARMTVTEHTEITDDVRWLSKNPDNAFSSIHWQLDANFAGDFTKRRFAEWVSESYNPGIRMLVNDWVDHMENSGKVLRWYPFLDPMDDLLHGRTSLLRCGSGHSNYSIMTDGHITPCPVMIGMKQYYLGQISHTDPRTLPHVSVEGDCTDCRIRDFCGGRCLYSNITKPWSKEERSIVCHTVKNLFVALNEALPRVLALLEYQKIDISAFNHEKYNGCEIIP
jgi:putative peptide-modifying radical SAM enzyme